jgi:hypothetical protein
MLVGNLLIRIAVAGIIAAVMWLPCFLLLDSTTLALVIIFAIVFPALCGLWDLCDMTGLKDKIERMRD